MPPFIKFTFINHIEICTKCTNHIFSFDKHAILPCFDRRQRFDIRSDFLFTISVMENWQSLKYGNSKYFIHAELRNEDCALCGHTCFKIEL